ncbi:MAG: hypothetical protein ABI895_01190 [Deltaproteobacteria bacterium]
MTDTALRTPSSSAVWAWIWARRAALLLGAVAALGFGVTLYLCAPGYMAFDSGVQLEQARSFEFLDDHPVLMALVWHYTDRVLPGPIGILLLATGLSWAGLGGIFWALPGPLFWRALGILGVGFFPPVFSCFPTVMKDALMHGALLAGLACIAAPTRRAFALRSLSAFVLFLFAIGVRHNAAAATWPFLALPFLRWLPIQKRWLRLLVASGIALGLAFGMTRLLDRALAPLSHQTEFWQYVPAFDLAGMSLQEEEVLVEPETTVLTEGMGLEEIRTLFRVDYGAMLYYCIPFQGERCVHLFRQTLDGQELRQLSDNWLRAIWRHPGAYLAHRFDFARALFTVNRGPKELYYLEGAPHHPLANDYPTKRRAVRVMAWLERHLKHVPYQPWIYALIAVVLIPVSLFRYRRTEHVLPLLFALSASSCLLSVMVGASSTNYRYCVWTIAGAVLSLVATQLESSRESSIGPREGAR